MDESFWIDIANNDYKIPEGHTLEELTKTLFGYLGSTDPELRDDIAYIVYANFLKREMYSQDEIRTHVDELLANLENGIGETNTELRFPENLFCPSIGRDRLQRQQKTITG